MGILLFKIQERKKEREGRKEGKKEIKRNIEVFRRLGVRMFLLRYVDLYKGPFIVTSSPLADVKRLMSSNGYISPASG